MKKILFLFFVICFSILGYAQEALTIHLGCESTLAPLYLAVTREKSCPYDESYVKQLEGILAFDLNHNGRTYVTRSDKNLSSLFKEATFDQKLCAEQHLSYVIRLTMADRASAQGFVVNKNEVKRVDNIALTGHLAQDRRKMHAIADALFEAFFHTKGICSTHILYTCRHQKGDDSTEWISDIFEVDYDGANGRKLTDEGKLCVTPTFVPTRGDQRARNFVYVSYLTGQPKLYMGSLAARKATRLTFLRGNQLMPSISADGSLAAFVSDIAGNPEIFVQRFNEEQGLLDKPWQVTSFATGAQASPTFSPDGKQLAFVSNKDGHARIYVSAVPSPNASAKELQPRLISKANRENTAPHWSPNGKKLAYSAMTQGVRQIWIYDFVSQKESQLTSGAGHKESPCWAPNSEHLVYHVSKGNSAELYIAHSESRESFCITTGAGEKRFASWAH